MIDWRTANQDPAVFGDACDPHGHAEADLVYGTGPHVCPGRPLATRRLWVLVRAVMDAGTLVLAGEPQRGRAPVAGFRTVPVRIGAPRLNP